MPSIRASLRAVAKAFSLATVTISSISAVSRIVRDEAGADALDHVRAGLAAGEDRAGLGLDRDHPQAGLARLQHLRDAGEGAAGADAGDDRRRRSPPVSFQISSAVVRRWISGLAGLVNWLRHDDAGNLLQQLLGACDRAVHALLARRQLQLGAQEGAASCAARSTSIPAWSGSACSRAPRATKARAMPVLPEVGSIRRCRRASACPRPPGRGSC